MASPLHHLREVLTYAATRKDHDRADRAVLADLAVGTDELGLPPGVELRWLGVAGFATGAQLAMTRAYTRGKTLLSAALAYSTVIFSSLFGALFWGEMLAASAWLAVALVVLSGVAATHFSRTSPGEQD